MKEERNRPTLTQLTPLLLRSLRSPPPQFCPVGMMHRIIAYVLRDVNARPTYTLQQPGGEVTMVVELRQISCYFTKKFFVFEVSNEATGEFYATVEVFVCLYDYNDEHIGSNINQLQVSPPPRLFARGC